MYTLFKNTIVHTIGFERAYTVQPIYHVNLTEDIVFSGNHARLE